MSSSYCTMQWNTHFVETTFSQFGFSLKIGSNNQNTQFTKAEQAFSGFQGFGTAFLLFQTSLPVGFDSDSAIN
jgi:hypothetical protein